jgi:hypothetical protein
VDVVVAGVEHAASRATADKAPRILMFIFCWSLDGGNPMHEFRPHRKKR